MELKLSISGKLHTTFQCSNRTFMELKYHIGWKVLVLDFQF